MARQDKNTCKQRYLCIAQQYHLPQQICETGQHKLKVLQRISENQNPSCFQLIQSCCNTQDYCFFPLVFRFRLLSLQVNEWTVRWWTPSSLRLSSVGKILGSVCYPQEEFKVSTLHSRTKMISRIHLWKNKEPKEQLLSCSLWVY